jgi:hypothetical protein
VTARGRRSRSLGRVGGRVRTSIRRRSSTRRSSSPHGRARARGARGVRERLARSSARGSHEHRSSRTSCSGAAGRALGRQPHAGGRRAVPRARAARPTDRVTCSPSGTRGGPRRPPGPERPGARSPSGRSRLGRYSCAVGSRPRLRKRPRRHRLALSALPRRPGAARRRVVLGTAATQHGVATTPPRACSTPIRRTGSFTGGVLRLGHGERWAYHDVHTATWLGPATARMGRSSSLADAFVNVSGANALRPWWDDVPVRIVIDTDPALPDQEPQDEGAPGPSRSRIRTFTFGEHIGDVVPYPRRRLPLRADTAASCRALAGGRDCKRRAPSVIRWESYAGREHDGVRFGMKDVSFGRTSATGADGRRSRAGARRAGAREERSVPTAGGSATHSGDIDPWEYRLLHRGSRGLGIAKEAPSSAGWVVQRAQRRPRLGPPRRRAGHRLQVVAGGQPGRAAFSTLPEEPGRRAHRDRSGLRRGPARGASGSRGTSLRDVLGRLLESTA